MFTTRPLSVSSRRATQASLSALRHGGASARFHSISSSPCRPAATTIRRYQDGRRWNHNEPEKVLPKRFADFDVSDGTFIVTGGAQGLGSAMAEGLVEAGGKVYCLDRASGPSDEWKAAKARVVPEWGGSLHYKQIDVRDTPTSDQTISAIADESQRLDGLIAAAGIQQICPAAEYEESDVARMLSVNYTGVFMTATACARAMMKHKSHGSICSIASMSGLIANKGLLSPVYNSSKAASIQLARNSAMEWSPTKPDGTGGIRVNCLSPGHMITPMVEKNFEEVPGSKETWEAENMMGRLARPHEFKSAGVFSSSSASSFMTGNNSVIEGGHTAW